MISATNHSTDSTANTTANRVKTPQLEEALDDLLDLTLERGFFGTARLEWVLQDGSIQTIKTLVERIER